MDRDGAAPDGVDDDIFAALLERVAVRIGDDEAIVAARPDVVLSIERGKDSLQADAVYSHPGFALTPVAANKSFITMDGLYLLGFGPRTAAAARDLSVKLYPALAEGGAFTSALPAANCRQ